MLSNGVYPAAVTPFDAKDRVSHIEIAKLLAFFEASGCVGAVLAGTNGEGPSLTAPEKRDMLEHSVRTRGELQIVIGIATPSLEEARWLTRRGGDSQATAALVMPPAYFRNVPIVAIRDWFLQLFDSTPIPILVYNFPKMTGFSLDGELLNQLQDHPRFAGAKDSSGEPKNLHEFRQAVKVSHKLYVGDERLLIDALRSGWNGSISGVANVLPDYLSIIVSEWFSGQTESAETKFALVLPIIEFLRGSPQPATHKAILKKMDVLESDVLRLPLTPAPSDRVEEAAALITSRVGALFRC